MSGEIKNCQQDLIQVKDQTFPLIKLIDRVEFEQGKLIDRKIIKIYDNKQLKLKRRILLETFPKELPETECKEDSRNQTVEYIYFEGCIYFFKRIYIRTELDRKIERMQKNEQSTTHLVKNMKKQHKSYLQLYKYNLIKDTERRVEGFFFYEKDYYLDVKISNAIGNQFIMYSTKDEYNRQIVTDLEKSRELCKDLIEQKNKSVLVNVSTMKYEQYVIDENDIHRLIKEANKDLFHLTTLDKFGADQGDDEPDEILSHPNEDSNQQLVLNDSEKLFFKNQYFCLFKQRISDVNEKFEDSDSDSEYQNQRSRKKTRDFKFNFKVYRMDYIQKPVASFESRDSDGKFVNPEFNKFTRTLQLKKSPFTEENDYPNLKMFRDQNFISKEKNESQISKNQDDIEKIYARHVFIFSMSKSQFLFKYDIDLTQQEIGYPVTDQKLLIDNDFGIADDYNLNAIQKYNVENIQLPNQIATCSFDIFGFWTRNSKFNVIYPLISPMEQVIYLREGESKQSGKKKFKDAINLQLLSKLFQSKGDDERIKTINSFQQDATQNSQVTFHSFQDLQSILIEVMQNENFNLNHFDIDFVQGNFSQQIYLENFNQKDAQKVIKKIRYIEENLLLTALSRKDDENTNFDLKFFPQKVDPVFMEQISDGNPQASKTQKYLMKLDDENKFLKWNSKYCDTFASPQSIVMTLRDQKIKQQFEAQQGTFILEDPNNTGMYVSHKLLSSQIEDQSYSLEVESYHIYQNKITMIINIDKIFCGFTQLKYPLKKNEALINFETKIKLITFSKSNDLNFNFNELSIGEVLKLKNKNRMEKGNFNIISENYSEQISQSPFIVFIVNHRNIESQEGDQHLLNLCVLNCMNFECKKLNILPRDIFEKAINYSQIRLIRSSEREEIKDDSDKIIGYDSQYSFCYYTQNFGERHEVFDYSLIEKIYKSDSGRLEHIAEFRPFAQNMILANNDESNNNFQQDTRLIPMFCLKGQQIIGKILIKQGDGESIPFLFPRTKIGQKKEKFSWSKMPLLIKKKESHMEKMEKKFELFHEVQFKYKIPKMMKFDVKEAIVGETNRKFLISKAQYFKQFSYGPQFNNFELVFFLQETIKDLQNMIPFNFKKMITEGFKQNIEKTNIFQKIEILKGLTISDLYLKDPLIIQNAFKRDPSLNNPTQTYLQRISQDYNHDVKQDAYKNGVFWKETLYLASDFTLVNQIQRALEMGAVFAANIFIEQVMSLEQKNIYQHEMMQTIIQITNQKRIGNEIVKFFTPAPETANSSQLCNFELHILDPKAPSFARFQSNIYKINDFVDFANPEKEIVNKMIERKKRDDELYEQGLIKQEDENYFGKKEEEQEEFDICNSMFDFRYLIISEKFNKFKHGDSTQYRFDDFTLSQFIKNMEGNKNIYNQESIMRIIDYQWKETYDAVRIKFFIFIWLYFIPFLTVVFLRGSHNYIEAFIFTLCLVVQINFFFIELVQIWNTGFVEYVYEGFWNFIELSQFFAFMICYTHRVIQGFGESDGIFIMTLRVFLVTTGFFKIMFFIRIYENYGFLVQMVGNTMTQIVPFIVFFFLWIAFYAMLALVLKIETGTDYAGMGEIFKYLIMTYRNSVGDNQPPGYAYLDRMFPNQELMYEYSAKQFMIFIIWGIWLSNQVVNLIVLLNFLIAVISQEYDNVVAEQKMYKYQHKADLNREHFLLQFWLGNLREFQAIVFQIDRDDVENEEDYIAGFVASIKYFITKQNQVIFEKLEKNEQQSFDIQEELKILKRDIAFNQEAILQAIQNK